MEMEMERYHKGGLADWLTVETGFILQLNGYRTITRLNAKIILLFDDQWKWNDITKEGLLTDLL